MTATMTKTKIMTAPTKEEAAAIQRCIKDLRAAELAMSRAYRSLDSVRGSVLRELEIVTIRCLNLLCQVSEYRGKAQLSAEKISSSVSDDDR
jgi:hypothetical protein